MQKSVFKKEVTYKGMKCRLYDTYLAEDDGPLVKICNSKDIDKAYSLGFQGVGYPDEIVKKVTEDEYEVLCKKGYIK